MLANLNPKECDVITALTHRAIPSTTTCTYVILYIAQFVIVCMYILMRVYMHPCPHVCVREEFVPLCYCVPKYTGHLRDVSCLPCLHVVNTDRL